MGTVTGRLTCSGNVNFHSLPNKQGLKKSIKSRFEDGFILVADWNAMEFRTAIAIAEQTMLAKTDIHTEAAKILFEKKEVTEEEREQAKIVNFASIYGSTQREHMEVIEQLYPKLFRKITNITKDVEQQRKIINLFGRKRIFKQETNFRTRGFNNYIQGIAADLCLRSLYLLQEKFEQNNLESKIILTVHDSIVLDCTKKEIKIIGQLIREVMTNTAIPSELQQFTHFPTTISFGNNYEDIKKFQTIYKDER